MENIDEFMRQRINGEDPTERFVFREEYWQQAEALLAERERRKRRGWWWLWFLLGGLLLAGGGWWVCGRIEEKNQVTTVDGKSGVEPGATTRDDSALNGKEPTEQEQSGTAASATKNTDSSIPDNDQPKKTTEKVNAAATEVSPKTAPESTPKKGRSGLPRLNAPTPTSPNQSVPNALAQKNASDTSAVERTTPGIATTVPTDPASPHSAADFLTEKTAGASAQGDLWSIPASLLPTLSTPPVALLRPPVALQKIAAPPVAAAPPLIEPHRDRRWSAGLAAAGTYYQGLPNSSGGGGVGGGWLSYRFAPQWAVTTGLQWRYEGNAYTDNDSAATLSSEQKRYSFGFVEDVWQVTPQALSWLEVPLTVRRQSRHWSAEAGVALGRLRGVRTVEKHDHRESLQPDATSNERRFWGAKTDYRSNYLSLLVGADWRATPRISLGLRGALRPGTVRRTEGYEAPNQTFWLDLGLRYRLF